MTQRFCLTVAVSLATFLVFSFGLVVCFACPNPACDAPINTPISVSVSPNPVCVGQTVTITTSDQDKSDTGQPVPDNVNIVWDGGSAPPSSFSTAGTYQYTARTNNDGDPRLCDETGVHTVTINVCGINSLMASKSTLVTGCWDPPDLLYVYGNVDCSGQTVQWSKTEPLLYFDGDPDTSPPNISAIVRANAPDSGCSQTGTVTATVGGCTASVDITVKKSGPYTVTQVGEPVQTRYCGTQTWEDIGEYPPMGCYPLDPVYGINTMFTFRMYGNCPIPISCRIGEEFEPGDGCVCTDAHEWRYDVPAGALIDGTFTDTYGFWGCNPNSLTFLTPMDCKLKPLPSHNS